jgi:spermidine synthase
MSDERQVPVRAVLAAFLVSGAAALIYEVAWTRALSLVLGSTVYALSTMLATFMAGLAIGAWLGGKLADRSTRRLMWFGVCELGVALFGLLSVPMIYSLPQAYLWVYRSLHLSPGLFFSAQIVLCAAVMLVPTMLMGATFPLVARSITSDLSELGRKVGDAYSFNTVGAVIGSLSVGFVLIPRLGVHGAAVTAAGLNLVVAVVMLWLARVSLRKAPVIASVLITLLLGTWAVHARPDVSLLSFYSAHRVTPLESYSQHVAREGLGKQLVYEGEFAEGSVRAFKEPSGHLLLQVDGKIEGTAAIDVPNTLLLAYLPIASYGEPKNFLNIGLGAGVTLEAAKDLVPNVDLVEINPGVLEAVRLHGRPGLLDGVSIERTDARNLLLRTDKRWDVISSEPSYPTESTVANLFTREFYDLAASRLSRDGVFCQWLPYYILTNDDVTMMIKTFGSVFSETTLWKIPGSLDLILIGSLTPLESDTETVLRRAHDLHRSRGGQPPISFVLSRTPDEIREIVARREVPVHTDDHPILEFRAASNLLLGDLARRERAER